METLVLKNFAKLKDTTLNINDITLIAGKPGMGKSYIMKMLYAINESFNIIDRETDSYKEKIIELKKQYKNKKKFEKVEEKELETFFEEFKNSILGKTDNIDDALQHSVSEILKSIFNDIDEISNSFKFSYDGIKLKYKENKITFKAKSNSSFYHSVFVETPLILEFKPFINKRKGAIPYHIESLLDELDRDYSIKTNEEIKFINSFIEKSQLILDGEIKTSNDAFVFINRKKKSFNITNVSSGIKSIGLLQYLVSNNVLKKDSILFWEEPEVHLHPSWQKKMVELFLELQKNGVKIVFSTHSAIMADYLNILVKKRKLEDKVSFNLLSEKKEGIVENIILNNDNWKLLQDELLGALEEIMWEYL